MSTDDFERHLRKARWVKEETARLANLVGEEGKTLSGYWRDGEVEWTSVERDLVCARELRDLIDAERPVDPSEAGGLLQLPDRPRRG
jgi:hypothetical protein